MHNMNDKIMVQAEDKGSRSVSGLLQTLCERSHMVVGAKVCDLTDGFLWFVCGLYVGILTSPLSTSVNRS